MCFHRSSCSVSTLLVQEGVHHTAWLKNSSTTPGTVLGVWDDTPQTQTPSPQQQQHMHTHKIVKYATIIITRNMTLHINILAVYIHPKEWACCRWRCSVRVLTHSNRTEHRRCHMLALWPSLKANQLAGLSAGLLKVIPNCFFFFKLVPQRLWMQEVWTERKGSVIISPDRWRERCPKKKKTVHKAKLLFPIAVAKIAI